MSQVIVRTMEMENGNKVHFTSGPVYPSWTISFDKGGIPAELSGRYTDFEYAVRAAKTYLEKTRAPRNRTKLKSDVTTNEDVQE